MSRRWRRVGMFLLGAGVVATVATLVIRSQVETNRRELFSANGLRRLAALGHMAGEPASVGAVAVLRDFCAWEPKRLLRSRAASILTRMETELGREVEAD